MKEENIVQPNLTVLTPEQVQRVHEYSLKILSAVGLRVDSERARRLFAKALGSNAVADFRVRISAELVEWALQVSPASLEIYDRNGSPAFHLPGPARFGIGVTTLYYQDPQSDTLTPFARAHMEASVRLGDALSGFDVISTMGIIQDLPPEVADLYATLEMTANTTKPLIILISEEQIFPAVLDLLEHLHGDLCERPSVIPYFNPVSPLVMNKDTIDKMWTTIERGLPFIYSNYGMAGASTPITPAGALALLNAELLGGLVLSQLIQEGTPVILGSLPAYFDMQGMGSFYDPQSYLVNLACAEMMDHYRLPHAGTSGAGQGWGADLIAGGHQWFNHLVCCLGKVGLVPFVGNNLDSKAFQPAVVIYADDIIKQARLFARGFALDDAAVGLQEIAQAGPGGNFLTSGLTLKGFREAYHRSGIFSRLTLEKWQEIGCPRAEEKLRSYTRQLMESSPPPEDHSDVLMRGEAFIKEFTGRGG